MVVAPAALMTEEWLGSELASHVACYGVWIKGAGAWRSHASVSPNVVARKAARLRRQIGTFGKLFQRSNSARELKHRKSGATVGDFVAEGLPREDPVPPTRVLDEEWRQLASAARFAQPGATPAPGTAAGAPANGAEPTATTPHPAPVSGVTPPATASNTVKPVAVPLASPALPPSRRRAESWPTHPRCTWAARAPWTVRVR